MTDQQSVVLIHGLFLTKSSWQGWVDRYTSRGFNVLAAAWPGLDRSVAELRADPSPLIDLTIEKILDDLDASVRAFDSSAIIMGHSFGGLFAQLLAYRGLGSAVVGIDATAPAGVLDLPFSTLKASAPVLANPLNVSKATMLTPEQFHYAFTNTLTPAESNVLYDMYAVPCANRVLFEGAFENVVPHSAARIDVTIERPPILLISGGSDHLVTPGYTRKNYELISRSPSTTSLKEYPDRPHFTGVVPGWEEISDYALDWSLRVNDALQQPAVRVVNPSRHGDAG